MELRLAISLLRLESLASFEHCEVKLHYNPCTCFLCAAGYLAWAHPIECRFEMFVDDLGSFFLAIFGAPASFENFVSERPNPDSPSKDDRADH
jgi:hypothetical protein